MGKIYIESKRLEVSVLSPIDYLIGRRLPAAQVARGLRSIIDKLDGIPISKESKADITADLEVAVEESPVSMDFSVDLLLPYDHLYLIYKPDDTDEPEKVIRGGFDEKNYPGNPEINFNISSSFGVNVKVTVSLPELFDDDNFSSEINYKAFLNSVKIRFSTDFDSDSGSGNGFSLDFDYDVNLLNFGNIELQIDIPLANSLDSNNSKEVLITTGRHGQKEVVTIPPENRTREELPLGGRSAKEVWEDMKCIAGKIHSARIKYGVYNDNGNSVVRAILEKTGIPLNVLRLPSDNHKGWGDILPVSGAEKCEEDHNAGTGGEGESTDAATDAKTYVPPFGPQGGQPNVNRDPLALDLDGDGIETVGLSANIHFDHDGDSFKELSGAIAADDGLLVLDINGDGQINSGAELFGNNTFLADGELAENGFEALAELDSNDDGIIDDKDARYAELRIWRDIDQDGETDEGELFILEDLGVQSLNTAYDEQDYTDTSGNEHRQVGSYTNTSGEERALTDVWFTSNPTLTQEEIIEVSSEISVLPDIVGSGNSRSLHQAMARDESGKLQSLVEGFVIASTRKQRLALTEQIIFAWTGQEGEYRNHFNVRIDARRMGALEVFYGHEMERPIRNFPLYISAFNGVFDNIADAIFARLSARSHLAPFFREISWNEDAETGIWEGDFSGVVSDLFDYVQDNPAQARDTIQDFAHAVRGVNPYNTINVDLLRRAVDTFLVTADLSGYTGATIGIASSGLLNASEGADRIDGNNGHNFLYGFGGNDQINGMGGNDVLDGGTGDDVLEGGAGDDEYRFGRGYGQDRIRNTDIVADRNDIVRLIGGLTEEDITVRRQRNDLVIAINDSEDVLRVESHFHREGVAKRYINAIVFDDDSKLAVGPSQFDALNIASQSITTGDDDLHGSSAADILDGLAGDDAIYGKDGNDQLTGGADNDKLFGDAGADTLLGGAGDDELEGGKGADTLRGDAGDDVLEGGEEADRLEGGADNDTIYGGKGDDVLEGGTGADTLVGGVGDDSYRFNLGDGLDVIVNQGSNRDTDKIVLGAGIVSEDTIIRRTGNDLNIIIREGTDAIRIKSYYRIPDYRKAIDSLVFEDASSADTSWDRAELERLASMATTQADELHGDNTANTIDGLAGDDVLIGHGGKDVLIGGADNDRLEGGLGDDTLEGGIGDDVLKGGGDNDNLSGGTGDDTLIGGYGNDSYKIAADGSHDVIQDQGSHITDIDKIIFAEGITQAHISYSRTATDLIITISKDDILSTVTIQDSFRYRRNQIEQLVFADNTTVSIATVLAAVSTWTGTDEVESIYGDVADDRLDGGAGNDRLFGYGGDDKLIGGAGDDTLCVLRFLAEHTLTNKRVYKQSEVRNY